MVGKASVVAAGAGLEGAREVVDVVVPGVVDAADPVEEYHGPQ